MGVQERKARHKEELRQEILEVARKLFVEEGFKNVSMRRIAERIEYSPATIYLHFKDKSELIFELCEETFARLVERQEQLNERTYDSPIDFLREGLSGYVEFGVAHPDHYRVTFMMADDEIDPSTYQSPDCMGMRAFGNLRAAVEACVQQGLFPKQNADTAAQALWAGVHGLVSLYIVMPEFPWADRQKVTETLISGLIEGLQAG
jgi:AcrR family transcriptional regulator